MNYTLFEHPIITHKLTEMRNVDTPSKIFRQNLNDITSLMTYEVTKDLPLKSTVIRTPLVTSRQKVLSQEVVIIPILRAGLGMVDGMLNVFPEARVGHVGMERNEETLEPHTYYYKVPDVTKDSITIVVDPMLATGGSASETISELKRNGIHDIRLVCLLGVPEGINRINSDHPDVDIYLGALDDKLNENGYIVPGLGDAGDRIFGTY
jgi:uracil phosphoribosyltransferase